MNHTKHKYQPNTSRGHEEYRQQAAQYQNLYLINSQNATHDMNKSMPAASSGMYAPNAASMGGAGPQHQPGTTSVVQQSQMNYRPIMMSNMQARANPQMANMSRNPMGSVNQVVQQSGSGNQYQHVQNVVLQTHPSMHGSIAAQHSVVFAPHMIPYGAEAQGVPLQVRKFPRTAVPYASGSQQYFMYYPTTTPPNNYYPIQHMQPCPPSVNNMPENQPPQQSTKKKSKALEIIDPATGEDILKTMQNSNTDGSSKETSKQIQNSEAAAQFASQVAAAVASKDPNAHRLSEGSVEPEPAHLENQSISKAASESGNGDASTPEICDPYVEDELDTQENSTYLYPKDRIEADSITNSVEMESLCAVSYEAEPMSLVNHGDLIDKPSIPEAISAEVAPEIDTLQESVMSTNCDDQVDELVMPAEAVEVVEAVPLAEDALASSNKVSDIIISKLEKSPVETRKNKTKKKKELNKKGDSKEGGDMDAFCIDEDSTGTPTSPPSDVEPTPVPVSSSVPSVTSQSPEDRAPGVDGALLNSLPPPDEVEKPQEEVNDVQTPDDASVISDDALSEKKDEEEESMQSDNKIALKYNYKEDQWSPLNPEGKKQYDREFLLKLQSLPMSMKRPDNLPKLEVIKDKAQLHTLNEVNRIPSVPMPARVGMGGYDPFIPMFARPQNLKPPHPGVRRSQQGREKPKKVVAFSSSLNQSVKLHESQNAWKPSYKSETEADNPEIQELYKRFRGILNKLTPQKFDTLLNQVKELEINTEERLNGVIDLVFEKAIDEPNFSVPYANMCKQLAKLKVPTKEDETQQVNFRKLLLTKCQKEFEQDRNDELMRAERLLQIENCEKGDQKKQLQEEFDEEERKNKRRQLGNIRFIGELFKLEMLVEPIMHECIKKLLIQGDEDSLECLCRLLMTIGKELETRREKSSESPVLDYNFNEMQKIVDKRKTTSRVRFMLQDVIDLRRRNWVPRRDENNPKTIDQIHKDVEREAHEKQQMLQNMTFTPKRLPDDNRRKLPNSGRSMTGFEDGWITSNKGSKANCSIDPTKLKITKPQEVENILLGPSGRGYVSWSRGSSGGGGYRSSMESDNKLPTVVSNRYNALSDQQLNDSRRGSQRSSASSRENSRGRTNQVSSYIRKTPSITKDRENVIEAVSMLSRTGQPEQKVPEPAKVPDVQTVNGKDSTENAAVFKGVDLKEEDVKRKTKPLIDEFLLNNDIKEATRCITEMSSANTVHLFVTEAINQVLERTSQSRHLFGKLLHSLVKSNILSMEQYCKGMESVLQYVDDYEVDIPKIFEYMGEIIEPMFEGNVASLLQIKETIKVCIPSMSAGKLMSGILKVAAKTRGDAKVGELWLESEMKWTDFLPPESNNIDEFVAREKIEFTLCPVKSEPVPMPLDEVKKQLAYLLKGVENNETIYDWIDAHIGEERCVEPTFVRALVTVIFENVITGSADVCELSSDKLKTRTPLLTKYVTVKHELQLQALYAVQALMNQLDQPKGVLRQIFNYLYDDDVVIEEVFKQWECSTDPAEQAGKGVARSLVSSFFTWLREGEESEDG